MRRVRLALLILVVATLSCDGTEPIPTEPEPSSEASLMNEPGPSAVPTGSIEERLQLRLAFDDEELAPETHIAGRYFSLHVVPSFDSDRRLLTMAVSVQNSGDADVWRPLRLEVIDYRPTSVSFDGPDNGVISTGAVWDYGQDVGLDGRLVPGEISGPRRIQVGVRSDDEQSLHSLRFEVRLTGLQDPAIPPSATREPTVEEAESGYSIDMVTLRYVDGRLASEELAKVNLEYGLAGQEFDDLLQQYLAFVIDGGEESTEKTRQNLVSDPRVKQAQRVTVQSISQTPSLQEALPSQVLDRFPAAWNAADAAGRDPGEGVIIAILDDGIDADHPELQGVVTKQIDARYGFDDPLPPSTNSHGTRIAGIIAASRSDKTCNVVGSAYGARLISIKIHSNGFVFGFNAERGFKVVQENPEISIVNYSISGKEDDSSLLAAIRSVVESGVLVVASAGNDGSESVGFPARANEVVAVGGLLNLDGTMYRDPASNYGQEIEFSAPFSILRGIDSGGQCLDLSPNGAYPLLGTSYSAPQVAAVAAIVKGKEPALSGSRLRERLRDYVVDIGDAGRDEYFGYGRIVAAKYGLVYNSQRPTKGIYTVDESGSQRPQLLYASYPYAIAKVLQVSPTGAEILFLTLKSFDDPRMSLTSISTDGGVVSEIIPPFEGEISAASWSPDGSEIVYSAKEAWSSGPDDLFYVSSSGGNPTRITDSDYWYDVYPVWFPYGRDILFWRFRDGDSGLYRTSATPNAAVTPIPTLGRGAYPDISPDGQWVAYTADSDRNFRNIVMSRTDGSGARTIVYAELFGAETAYGGGFYPKWSPDGSTLAFVAQRQTEYEINQGIYVIHPDGTGLRKVTDLEFWNINCSLDWITF